MRPHRATNCGLLRVERDEAVALLSVLVRLPLSSAAHPLNGAADHTQKNGAFNQFEDLREAHPYRWRRAW